MKQFKVKKLRFVDVRLRRLRGETTKAKYLRWLNEEIAFLHQQLRAIEHSYFVCSDEIQRELLNRQSWMVEQARRTLMGARNALADPPPQSAT